MSQNGPNGAPLNQSQQRVQDYLDSLLREPDEGLDSMFTHDLGLSGTAGVDEALELKQERVECEDAAPSELVQGSERDVAPATEVADYDEYDPTASLDCCESEPELELLDHSEPEAGMPVMEADSESVASQGVVDTAGEQSEPESAVIAGPDEPVIAVAEAGPESVASAGAMLAADEGALDTVEEDLAETVDTQGESESTAIADLDELEAPVDEVDLESAASLVADEGALDTVEEDLAETVDTQGESESTAIADLDELEAPVDEVDLESAASLAADEGALDTVDEDLVETVNMQGEPESTAIADLDEPESTAIADLDEPESAAVAGLDELEAPVEEVGLESVVSLAVDDGALDTVEEDLPEAVDAQSEPESATSVGLDGPGVPVEEADLESAVSPGEGEFELPIDLAAIAESSGVDSGPEGLSGDVDVIKEGDNTRRPQVMVEGSGAAPESDSNKMDTGNVEAQDLPDESAVAGSAEQLFEPAAEGASESAADLVTPAADSRMPDASVVESDKSDAAFETGCYDPDEHDDGTDQIMAESSIELSVSEQEDVSLVSELSDSGMAELHVMPDEEWTGCIDPDSAVSSDVCAPDQDGDRTSEGVNEPANSDAENIVAHSTPEEAVVPDDSSGVTSIIDESSVGGYVVSDVPDDNPVTTDKVVLDNPDIEDNAQAMIAELPVGSAPPWVGEELNCVVVQVHGINIAVPMDQIESATALENVSLSIDVENDWILGQILSGDHTITYVLDSACWLMPELYDPAKAEYKDLLMLQGGYWGVACDEMVRSVRIPVDKVSWAVNRSKRPWLLGTYMKERCAILDVDALIDQLNAAF